MTSKMVTMETQLFQFASYLMKVDMMPVFFTAHLAIACIIVREDSKDLGRKFRQNHPFAMWFCTLIAGLSGVFVASFLFGDPLISILAEHHLIIFLTVIWYLMNYSPFDIVYKIVMFPPVIITASVLQECLRVRFLYLGLQEAARLYPKAHLIILLGGIIKGNGYGFIKIVERLVRGKWTPSSNEILDVTYFAKSGLYASVLFLLHHMKLLDISIEMLYFGIVAAFVMGRLLVTIGKVPDPLLPLEAPVCALLFGSGEDEDDKKVEKKEEKPDRQREDKQKSEKEKKDKKTK